METVYDTRWQLVREAFEAALSLPEDTRAAFLDLRCGADAALRAEVEALLKVATSVSRDDATQPSRTLAWDAASEPRDNLIGRQLGQWRVERILGAGGMGAVYLGRRVSGDFDQDVAIKLLHIGISRSPEIAARFRSERQILAQLDHPYIARLLDGGTLPEGLPYLVMEFVEGEPIALHCQLRKLPVSARVELMIKVCRAVQAAHRNLIVHRDLKPDNILVDSHGEPKLLDFGIAKVLDDAGGVQTHADQRLLTPRYGAPEQFKGEPITTATDVYSLGVTLYELLTGVSPYEVAGGDTMGLVREVCEVDPRSPSERREHLSRGGNRLDDLRFGADLDAIVMKTLRKRPEDRYGSVDTLIDDLQRYLRDEPVLARQSSRSYRMRKFARRHRLALSLAAMALLAAATTALVWREQRDQVASERDKARAVTAFLVELFDQGDPFLHPGKPPTVEEVVRRGAERLSSEQLADPLVRAELALSLSRVYLQIGSFPGALELARRADADVRAGHGDALLEARAAERLAEALMENDQLDAAAEEWQRALDLAPQTGSEVDATRAAALAGLGDLRRAQRRYADAVAALEQALALHLAAAGHADLAAAAQSARPGRPDEIVSRVAHTLCRTLGESGQNKQAGTICRQTLALKQRVYGAEHPAQASTLVQMANLSAAAGDSETALQLSRQVLAQLAGALGPDHPRVGVGQLNLGADLRALDRLDEAETAAREAMRIFTLARGADHAHTLLAQNNLANILYSQGRFEDALAAHREVAERRARTLPADDPALAQSQYNIGKCLYRLGRWAEAETAWSSVLRAESDAATGNHRLAQLGLALLRLEQGDARAAADEGARISAEIAAEDETRLGLATALYLRARALQVAGAPADQVHDLAAEALAALEVDISRDLLDLDRLRQMAEPD